MKKYFLSLFLCCMCFFTLPVYASTPIDAKLGIPFEYTPSSGSVEELYKDMIVTQLTPYIDAEIEKQYGQLLQYDLFDIKFLNIKRDAYRGFSFLLNLQVNPFVGAHNTIGIDNLTISITPSGTKVENFQHLKSFPIPPWLEESYKDLKTPPITK